MLKSWVDGEEKDLISIQDRGLMYGDGFFTTMAVKDASPYLLDYHLERIRHCSENLHISISLEKIKKDLSTFIKEIPQTGRYILKIIITRGEGQRSYKISNDSKAKVIFELFEFNGLAELESKRNDGLNISFCQSRISHQPRFAGVKHLNRLENVLLASEPHLAGFHEAFVFDDEDYLIEGLSSNVFLLKEETLSTPLLDKAGVEGVVKAWIKSELQTANVFFKEKRLVRDDILAADAILMTNCIMGICKVSSIDQCHWKSDDAKLNVFLERLNLDQVSF